MSLINKRLLYDAFLVLVIAAVIYHLKHTNDKLALHEETLLKAIAVINSNMMTFMFDCNRIEKLETLLSEIVDIDLNNKMRADLSSKYKDLQNAEYTHELGAKSCGTPILKLANDSRISLDNLGNLSASQLRDAVVDLPGISIEEVETGDFEISVGADYCYAVYTCEPFIRQC